MASSVQSLGSTQSLSPFFKTNPRAKPEGFPSHKQNYRINAQGNIDQFTTHELLRFQFSTQNWFDPYSCYFEFEIEMDTDNFGPYDVLALDGPSTSLISELILHINGNEVERTYEHDQIAKFMNDFNMRSKRKIYKWYEGYVHDTPELNTTHHMMAHGGHTKVPVMTEAVSGNSYIQAYAEVADIYAFGNNTSQCYNMAHPLQGGQPGKKEFPTTYTRSNKLDYGPNLSENFDLRNHAGEENLPGYDVDVWPFHDNDQPSVDPTHLWTPPCYGQVLSVYDPTWGIQHASAVMPFQHYNSAVSEYTFNDTRKDMWTHSDQGFQRPYSPYVRPDKYAYLCYGPMDVTQQGLYTTSNGYRAHVWDQKHDPGTTLANYAGNLRAKQYEFTQDIQRTRFNTRKTFLVPLLSNFMGHLIPEGQHRLLPGKWFKQIYIEARLNRYAFFTSGLRYGGKDVFDAGMTGDDRKKVARAPTMLPRNWTIKKADFIMELVQMPTQIEAELDQSYGNEIRVIGQQYYLAHKQQFANTMQLESNFYIHQKHRSVKSIWWWTTPNDYMKYSCCRKHYRISANTTKYQLQFGNVYWPYHEVKGHAGNYIQNETLRQDQTNQDMIYQLYDAMGHKHADEVNIPFNPVNFGINDRAWDPTVLDKDPGLMTGQDISQAFYGMPLFHEWRQGIGGGVYCINFETIPQTGYSGLDLSNNVEPLILRLEVDKQNYFNRECTFHIWFLLDVEFVLRKDGTSEIIK